MLGDYYLGGVVRLRVIHGRPVQQHYHIRVLLDSSRFPQVRHYWPVICALFRAAGKLTQENYWNVQLPGEYLQLPRSLGYFQYAVIVLARGLHKLQIVNDHHVQPNPGLQPAALAAYLGHAAPGGIVYVYVRLGEGIKGGRYAYQLRIGYGAGADRLHVYAGIGAEHTLHQLLSAHLQAEYAYGFLALYSRVLGKVKGKSGLAHGGAAGDYDEIAGLHAGGELVQIRKACGNPGKGAVELHQFPDPVVAAEHRLADMHQRIGGLLHGYVEYCPLRVVQHLLKALFPRESV